MPKQKQKITQNEAVMKTIREQNGALYFSNQWLRLVNEKLPTFLHLDNAKCFSRRVRELNGKQLNAVKESRNMYRISVLKKGGSSL